VNGVDKVTVKVNLQCPRLKDSNRTKSPVADVVTKPLWSSAFQKRQEFFVSCPVIIRNVSMDIMKLCYQIKFWYF
jgi:hypothetical protein